jgi:hypothetical protein
MDDAVKPYILIIKEAADAGASLVRQQLQTVALHTVGS